MGLFGWGDSEARKKAKKYEKLVDALEGKINDIEAYITDAENALIADHNALILYPDSAEGMIRTTFDEKEEVWKGNYETVISNMESGVLDLKNLKSSASQNALYWNQVADMEEMKKNAGF